MPQFLGAGRPSDGGIGALLSADVSTWLGGHQSAVILVTGLTIAAATTTTGVWSRHREVSARRTEALSEPHD